MGIKRLLVTSVAAALAIAGAASIPSHAATAALTQGCVPSVAEPGSADPVLICYTLYQPAGATAEAPVPLIFHSHGWGGSRTNEADAFAKWIEAGFGVLSFDQRGFGESGGKAHVEDPAFEGQDITALVDFVAGRDWVTEEAPGDPLIGAIGGSYGGGYQMLGAFTDGRFDALAPEITWWDLPESLAPNGVARTAWVTALYAAGLDAHTDTVHQGFAYGAATGDWPAGQNPAAPDLNEFFADNGPRWHVEVHNEQLDIPVLFGQGIDDNLFNLNQGIKNFENALTPAARAQSIFVGYNGGHALPNLFPAGASGGVLTTSDPCSEELGGGSFEDLAIQFFKEKLQGATPALTGFGQYHLALGTDGCLTTASVAATEDRTLDQVISTAGAGAPQHVALADGPIRLAGVPSIDATVTTTSLEARAFIGLAVGTSPADARVVANNLTPLRVAGPTLTPVSVTQLDLAGLTVDVPAGQHLYLTVTPVADQFFGHGSRVAGALVLDDVTVHLPVR